MSKLRRGITLVEMSVVVTLTSLVLMLATTTLATLLRVNKQLNDDLAQDVALARLASHWRADVHAAEGSVMDEDCVLTLPDQRSIRYRFAAPAVTREVLKGDAKLHRDAFVLAGQARARFVREPGEGSRILRLEIERADLRDRAFAVPFRAFAFEAALGLHQRVKDGEARP